MMAPAIGETVQTPFHGGWNEKENSTYSLYIETPINNFSEAGLASLKDKLEWNLKIHVFTRVLYPGQGYKNQEIIALGNGHIWEIEKKLEIYSDNPTPINGTPEMITGVAIENQTISVSW